LITPKRQISDLLRDGIHPWNRIGNERANVITRQKSALRK